jgi:phosphoglucosamine mutase
VRGRAGVDVTAALAGDLGRAAVLVAGPGARVVIGRDTRESGPSLEDALCDGIAAAGGHALRAGVMPTPGVAVLTRLEGADLGCVISASHNPHEDNGIKFLGADGRKLADAREADVEARLGEAGPGGGEAHELAGAADRYVAWLADRYGDGIPPRTELVLDCANGAAAAVAGQVAAAVGIDARLVAADPDGRNINRGVGSTHLEALTGECRRAGLPGVAFDGDADRCLGVTAAGDRVDGDAIIAALALDRQARGSLATGRVVVTSMTNLGFHRLMREHGIAVEVADVGDRYVLERMLATGAELGGEQSGHVVDLVHHTTGDGLATMLQLLAALARQGMTMTELAGLVPPFPQKLVAVPADRSALAGAGRVWEEVRAAEANLGKDGRVVVRASGTEPVVRVMVEAADAALCEEVCDHLAHVVATEIGDPDMEASI